MALAQRKTEIETAPHYTESEYLTLERKADERHEYLDGVIYAMAGESPKHGDISVNLIAEIAMHLKGKDCHTYTKDTKVRSGPLPKWRSNTKGLYSYPDLVVVCGERKYLDEYQDVLVNPTVIIEVLSNRTEWFDRKQKFLRYQQYLPSLVDYVLVSQNEPTLELYHRPSPKSSQWEFTMVNGLKSRLFIPSLKCWLRLADVYYRVTFPPAENGRGEVKQTKPRSTKSRKSAKPTAKKKSAVTAKKKK
ncbi:MAG: Uma2 family endonuclease [Acidobacteria bacterium]|nr:Uma2 family endonuclease [Acidobacteriota bacterium]